jgi:hypothetical protein
VIRQFAHDMIDALPVDSAQRDRMQAAADRFIESWERDADTEAGEGIAAMADHRDQPRQFTFPLSRSIIEDLHQLALDWQTAGMGPDGPFVDVSGVGRQGDPAFPLLLARMLDTHIRKNAAYVGSDPDPLANYVNAGRAIGVPGFKAAYMRMAEKMSRLRTQLLDPSLSDGEGVEDTLIDVAVIALLTISLYRVNR